MLGIDTHGSVAILFLVLEEGADIRLEYAGTCNPDIGNSAFTEGQLGFRRQPFEILPVAHVAFGVRNFASRLGATQEILCLLLQFEVCNENFGPGFASQLDKGQVDAYDALVSKAASTSLEEHTRATTSHNSDLAIEREVSDYHDCRMGLEEI
jgi:hypothetical protein